MLHRITLDKLEMVINLNLIQGVKCIVVTLVITTTDKVELLSEWILNALEIMWEAAVIVRLHFDCLHSLVSDIQLVNVLRIFLKEMNYLNTGTGVLESAHIKCIFLRYKLGLSGH